MSFNPHTYRNNKDGIGAPGDAPAANSTDDNTLVSLAKKMVALLSGTMTIGLPSGAATSANQTTVNTTLTSIDGHVDGLEALVASTNTKLDTLHSDLGVLGGYVDTLEAKLALSSVGTLTSVADAATDATILALNTSRLGASIYNDSTEILYLLMSNATSSSTNFSVKLQPDGYFEIPAGYTGVIKGIWANNASGSARVTEYT